MQRKATRSRSAESAVTLGADYLHECFRYEEDTGRLFWRVRPLSHFPNEGQWKQFNSRFANKRAGKLCRRGYVVVRITAGQESHLMRGAYIVWVMLGREVDDSMVFKPHNRCKFDLRIDNVRHVPKKHKAYGPLHEYPGIRLEDEGWVVEFSVNGETKHVGAFRTIKDARKARDNAERECYWDYLPKESDFWESSSSSVTDIKIGSKFGDWEVIGEKVQDFPGTFSRSCQCRCGNTRFVREGTLTNGTSKGCGECRSQRLRNNDTGVGVRCRNWIGEEVVDPSVNTFLIRVRCLDCDHTQEVGRSFLSEAGWRECPGCRAIAAQASMKRHYWYNIVRGAEERDLAMKVTMEEAYAVLDQQDWKCAFTGIQLTMAKSIKEHIDDASLTTTSLDRINSEYGYVVGNIQWIHKRLNFMKGACSDDEFLFWCGAVASHLKLDSQGTTTQRRSFP